MWQQYTGSYAPTPAAAPSVTREVALRQANMSARSAESMDGEGAEVMAIYESVKGQVAAQGISPEEVPRLILLVVQAVQRAGAMSGVEKKRVAMRLVAVLVQDLVRAHGGGIDANYQNMIVDATIATASSAIETALDIHGGAMTKQTALARACGCLSSFALKTAARRQNARSPPSNNAHQ